MAYSFIPKSVDDIRSNTEMRGPDKEVVARAFQTFISMTTKNGKPEMEDPFAIDIKAPKKIKIHRSFSGEIDIKSLGDALGVSFEFGNESRGGMGAGNRGSLFERRLTKDFVLYSETRNPRNDGYFYKDFIQYFHDEYAKGKARDIVVVPEGALNKKRPLVFAGNDVYIEKPFSQANIGSTVTDITVTVDREPIYLSLKLGGTVTFFNIGVAKYIKEEEIDAGEITDPKGRLLLSIFGIDPVHFASVFKAAASHGRAKGLVQPPGQVDVTNKINRDKSMKFLGSGIGYGYHLVHAKNEISPNLDHMAMTKENMSRYLHINRMVVKYPPLGAAKRVDVSVDTPKFLFKLNFRNKGGGVYPSHLLCDYKIVHK